MGTLIGSVDPRCRPVVRTERPGDREGFLALLDTGFNGEIFVAIADLERLGFRLRGGYTRVELANGGSRTIQRAEGQIIWLGKPRRVEVFAAMDPPPARLADDPVALVGTQLPSPNMLLIDFAASTVEIEQPD